MSAGHRDCRGWGTCFVTGREYFINIFIFLFLETSGYEQQKQDEKNQRKPVEAFAKFILADIFFIDIYIYFVIFIKYFYLFVASIGVTEHGGGQCGAAPIFP